VSTLAPRKHAPAKRNAIASTLSQACFRKRIVKAKIGPGSYARRPKHPACEE
jgi:stalled ribosome alternative rescue factor ArfA